MKTYPLTVSSPDGNLFKGPVAQLILRGSEGDLAVMAGHIPFMTAVQPGACRITLEDGTVFVGTLIYERNFLAYNDDVTLEPGAGIGQET